MARILLTVIAAAALCLACADPTPATNTTVPSETPLTSQLTPTTTSEPSEAPLTLELTSTTTSAPSEAVLTAELTSTTTSAPSEAVLTPELTSTTTSAPSEALLTPELTLTSIIGPRTLQLDKVTGTWWAYIRKGQDGPFEIVEMKITKKTPEEIAVYEQSWLPRNNSQNETNPDYRTDSINWLNVSFLCEIKLKKLNETYSFLFEALPDPKYLRIIPSDGRIALWRQQFTNGMWTLRDVSGDGIEFNFYRTLPDLATYARCENFDMFDASDAFDLNSLVGTWTTNRQIGGFFFTLRVTRITPEEISAYREDLRNTTVEEADIDWKKVRLEVELSRTSREERAHGLIEELDKPGSIRVIPLKHMWDTFGTREVDYWFTSQNFLIKGDDGFLVVRNCDRPWQRAYFSRRPQIRRRKMPWKPFGGRGGKKKNY